MKVRPRGVESFLDAQRLAALELRGKLRFDNQFVRAALEYGELMGDVEIHGMMLLLQLRTARSCSGIDRSGLGTLLNKLAILAQRVIALLHPISGRRVGAAAALMALGVVAAFGLAPD